ncbi:unnamed protein product [Prunus armeniaca]
MRLRQGKDDEAYTPQVVSIGPLHHGKQGLKAMEDHKKRYLQDYIRRTRCALSSLLCLLSVESLFLAVFSLSFPIGPPHDTSWVCHQPRGVRELEKEKRPTPFIVDSEPKKKKSVHPFCVYSYDGRAKFPTALRTIDWSTSQLSLEWITCAPSH